METIFWPLFLFVLAGNVIALVLAVRVAKRGKAFVEWLEEEFPDAVTELPANLRRRGAQHVLQWVDDHINFPDAEFGERYREYQKLRKQSNLALAACIGFVVLLFLFGRPA